jgi:hypothetical protein
MDYSTISPEMFAAFQSFLKKVTPQSELSESGSESGSESDSGSDCEIIKRGRGRPPMKRTQEWYDERDASKARGRGRPPIERSQEWYAEQASRAEAKEALRLIREEKKCQEESDKADKAEEAKQKRTEIYQRKLDEAEAYRLKYDIKV